MEMGNNSDKLFAEAQRYLPGGVDSPVRAFRAVGGNPLFITRGKGSKIFDADGREYIDFAGSWGPLILGHAPPVVVRAIKKAAGRGTSFGAPTEAETTLARMISTAIPSMEMLRFVSSGTEAVMSALRLARAFTGRDRIIKFAGGYHGHSDGMLVKAGSGLATLGTPDSAGVTASCAQDTMVASYNDQGAVKQLFERYPAEIAAVIVEPVAANMGVVPPQPGFLAGLRELTRQYGALLIFDEVITGFRVAYGGAQALYGITPDMTTLGKVIGGGLPVGAYGGRREIMQLVAPLGPVYQAGTLSGNPLAMAAGIATIEALHDPALYHRLEDNSTSLEKGIAEAAADEGAKVSIARVGSLLTVFCMSNAPQDYQSVQGADTTQFARLFHALLARGVYWPPSQFEAAFVSLAHSDRNIRQTVQAFRQAFLSLPAA
ncbi:MAG: glutamate-1-semialdehyde-2,1-aminomutase [Dehalococcoidia bacterium]|nr:MAG: glutamate-1-semialdehyde-2,1-aminomutase [Dehalococcoidia bacterium]